MPDCSAVSSIDAIRCSLAPQRRLQRHPGQRPVTARIGAENASSTSASTRHGSGSVARAVPTASPPARRSRRLPTRTTCRAPRVGQPARHPRQLGVASAAPSRPGGRSDRVLDVAAAAASGSAHRASSPAGESPPRSPSARARDRRPRSPSCSSARRRRAAGRRARPPPPTATPTGHPRVPADRTRPAQCQRPPAATRSTTCTASSVMPCCPKLPSSAGQLAILLGHVRTAHPPRRRSPRSPRRARRPPPPRRGGPRCRRALGEVHPHDRAHLAALNDDEHQRLLGNETENGR